MLRLARILLFVGMTLSVVLLVGVGVVWVRSYRQTDRVTATSAQGQKSLYSRQGHVVFSWLYADWSNQPASRLGMKYDRDLPAPPSQDLIVRLLLCSSPGMTESFHERAGFALYQRNRGDGVRYMIAVAPFWSLASASALLPLGCTLLRLRRAIFPRHPKGHCEKCGYDLRATPHQCPECGHVASPIPISRQTP